MVILVRRTIRIGDKQRGLIQRYVVRCGEVRSSNISQLVQTAQQRDERRLDAQTDDETGRRNPLAGSASRRHRLEAAVERYSSFFNLGAASSQAVFPVADEAAG